MNKLWAWNSFCENPHRKKNIAHQPTDQTNQQIWYILASLLNTIENNKIRKKYAQKADTHTQLSRIERMTVGRQSLGEKCSSIKVNWCARTIELAIEIVIHSELHPYKSQF